MAQTEMLQGLCPKCGEKLDVPAHLKQFSCMYCGARLTPSELAPAQQAPELDADAATKAYVDGCIRQLAQQLGLE